jgi:hypothetical protein
MRGEVRGTSEDELPLAPLDQAWGMRRRAWPTQAWKARRSGIPARLFHLTWFPARWRRLRTAAPLG